MHATQPGKFSTALTFLHVFLHGMTAQIIYCMQLISLHRTTSEGSHTIAVLPIHTQQHICAGDWQELPMQWLFCISIVMYMPLLYERQLERRCGAFFKKPQNISFSLLTFFWMRTSYLTKSLMDLLLALKQLFYGQVIHCRDQFIPIKLFWHSPASCDQEFLTSFLAQKMPYAMAAISIWHSYTTISCTQLHYWWLHH